MKRICRIAWAIVIIVVVLLVVLTGASFYMLDYSLSPDATRENADLSYRQLYEDYPETAAWVDSLRRKDALRDTFLTMANGERHHAYYVHKGSRKTALVIHGWRDQAIKYFFLGRMYERELGYNIVMPDLHASGKSEGEAIGMGWNDRLDVMQWMQTFQTDTMVVHGVS
ncbi:MAG: alpha/beta hydrolase, partial [Prevotella sp.]|nr:alpha/beta hydrolase [Prevotella sp.]